MSEGARTKYSGAAMALHWMIAVGVIANWLIRRMSKAAETEEAGRAMMANHFSIGVILWVLAVALLIVHFHWRKSAYCKPSRDLGAMVGTDHAHFVLYTSIGDAIRRLDGNVAVWRANKRIWAWSRFHHCRLKLIQKRRKRRSKGTEWLAEFCSACWFSMSLAR